MYLYTKPFTHMFTVACWGKEGVIRQSTEDFRPVKLLWILEWWQICPNPYKEQHQEWVLGDFSGGQWLRILLLMQGTRVWFLVGEDRKDMQQLGPCVTTTEAHVLSARDSTITEDMAMESLALQRRSSHWRSNAVKKKEIVLFFFKQWIQM